MAAGSVCGSELSFTDHCQNGGNILLQLLEFKAHLLEVIEELHIRRAHIGWKLRGNDLPDIPEQDTEERFQEQISKLMLEKQELEWDKESLQHQIETKKNDYTESLSKVKKQATIRNLEEEKSRNQVSAEQKDKDIQNLKEELKSLQLLKYNLEKKSSELEQKLVLQCRSKDSHLNQLGEVEKRFCALSRQCALVKQAHQKLEENVNEAMKHNNNLASANQKQEVTVASLKKEVEKLRNRLVKAKMSCVNHDKTLNKPSVKEEAIKQLQQKLNMEVLRSLQSAHQLLSNQTQTASRLELYIQTQKQHYQSLEQDHKAMQGKENALEKKIKQLMEEYTVSKNNWDKEKVEYLDRIKNGQQELMTIKEMYEELHQKHRKISSKNKEQIKDLDLTVFPANSTVAVGSLGDRSCNETVSSTDLPNTVHALTVAKDFDGLEDKEASIAMEGQAEHTEGCSREVISKSNNGLSVNGCRETIINNSSTVDEDEPELISKAVFGQTAVNRVKESQRDHINSSTATSNEVDFASVKPNMENMFKTTESGVELEGENKLGHTQDNCEDPKENVSLESENMPIKDRALENVEDNQMTDIRDGAIDTAMFLLENLGEDQGRFENRCQSEMTETIVDDKTPQETEDTESISEVYHSNSRSTLECTSLVNEQVTQAPPIQEISKQEVLASESEPHTDKSDVQYTSSAQGPTTASSPSSACRDLEGKTETVSVESTSAELPETLNKSSLCHSQNDAAQLDGVSVHGTIKMQTQVVSSPDTPGHMKGTVDNSAKECSPATQDIVHSKSQAEIPTLKINLTDPVATTSETSKNLTNDCENNVENEQVNIQKVNILEKSTLQCKQLVALESSKSQTKFVSSLKLSKSITKEENKCDLKADSSQSQSTFSPECLENSLEKEVKTNDESAAPDKTIYRSSFQWGSAQRRAQVYVTKSNMSAHNSSLSTILSNTSGCTGQDSVTLPMFLRRKQNTVPLTITRATDLLNGSSVCGAAAASSWRLQPTEWKAIGEAHRDTAAPMESKKSEPFSRDSTCPGTVNKGEEQKSMTLSPEASESAMSGWAMSGSQDTEDQQSAFRTQISKIEQFLSTERLRLPKRRKTEN